MKLLSDGDLIRAIQEGDILAYEILVKRYQHGLYVFIMRIVHDTAVSGDIAQDTLVKVYEIIDRIDTRKKFSTLVFEIAKNEAISYLRRKKHTLSLDEIVDIGVEESLAEDLYRSDIATIVRASVRALPVKYREVITLYYFHELSYEEIAKKIRMPINTVRTHLRRGKEMLRKVLQEHENNRRI
jgi:RNA polymerase sigma-70 factor, ECF subfamily